MPQTMLAPIQCVPHHNVHVHKWRYLTTLLTHFASWRTTTLDPWTSPGLQCDASIGKWQIIRTLQNVLIVFFQNLERHEVLEWQHFALDDVRLDRWRSWGSELKTSPNYLSGDELGDLVMVMVFQAALQDIPYVPHHCQVWQGLVVWKNL